MLMAAMEQRQKVLAGVLTAGSVVAACHLLTKYYTVKALANGQDSRPHSRTDFFEFVHNSRSQDESHKQVVQAPNAKGISYDWAQSFEEVLIEILVPGCVRAQDVSVRFGTSQLFVQVNQQVVIDGQLAGSINPQSSSWQLEGGRNKKLLSISLSKSVLGAADKRFAIWQRLLVCSNDDRQPAPDQQRA